MEGKASTPTVPLKHCRVCSDVALGFNFNGLSCESCKAFFRRNAIKNKIFKCRKTGACFIDKKSRKLCKKCRLEKCYNIGMKKELISVNREDTLGVSKEKGEAKVKPSDEEDEIKLETVHLQAYDLKRIQEVHNAMSVFKDEKILQMMGNATQCDYDETLSIAESFVAKILVFSKSFAAFTCLAYPDQITVLKSFYPEIASICTSFLYNSQRSPLPVDQIEEKSNLIFLRLEKGLAGELKSPSIVPTILRNFIHSMHTEMENDVTIRNLIVAQLLFKPRDSVNCHEFLKYNYWVYCHLLRRYLQHKYQDCEKAEVKFGTVMKNLSKIGQITVIFREMYLSDPDISTVSQTLIGIYSLL